MWGVFWRHRKLDTMFFISIPTTVKPLLKFTPNKRHLSIKDKCCTCGPYRTMAIQFYLLKRTTSL